MPARRASRLALGAAVLHALWNVLLARTRDPQAATAAAFCLGGRDLGAGRRRTLARRGGRLEVHRRRAPRSSSPTSCCSRAAYARAPLSVFYPIARGLAPVLVLARRRARARRRDLVQPGDRRLRRRRRASCSCAAAGPTGAATLFGARDRGDDRRLHADRQHGRHARRPARLPRGGDGRAGARDGRGRRRAARAGRRCGAGFRLETLLIAPLTLAPYALTLYALRLAPAAPVAAVRETSVLIVTLLAAVDAEGARLALARGGRRRGRRRRRPARRLDKLDTV